MFILHSKAVSRSVRAQLLMDAALKALLLFSPLNALSRESDVLQTDVLDARESNTYRASMNPTELPLPDQAMHPVLKAAQHIYDDLAFEDVLGYQLIIHADHDLFANSFCGSP